jgi:hypothetical protein
MQSFVSQLHPDPVSSGIGIREDESRITANCCRFVPHRFCGKSRGCASQGVRGVKKLDE